MTILGEPLELPGIIAWKKEVDFEHKMYGIQFILNDKERKRYNRFT